jgi:hypothetical protein
VLLNQVRNWMSARLMNLRFAVPVEELAGKQSVSEQIDESYGAIAPPNRVLIICSPKLGFPRTTSALAFLRLKPMGHSRLRARH